MNLDTEYSIAKALRTSPFPAALSSGETSSQHLPPCQEPAQQLGGARQCAVKEGMESWAGPGAASSCPDTLLQLFRPSSGCAEALQSQPRVLSSHTSKRKGLAPSCCCITAALAVLWPPLLLGHWHYCHLYCSGLMRKQLFGSARVASLMAHLPNLLKVSTCLHVFSLGSSSPPCPCWASGQTTIILRGLQGTDISRVWAWNQGTTMTCIQAWRPVEINSFCNTDAATEPLKMTGAKGHYRTAHCTPAPRRPYPMLAISYSNP